MELVAILVAIVAVLGAVVIVRRQRTKQEIADRPLITDVADYTTGMLSCPRCGGMSFQSPPGGGGDFFALALGPLVFGSMSKSNRELVECVTCASTFRRPNGGAYVKPAGGQVISTR